MASCGAALLWASVVAGCRSSDAGVNKNAPPQYIAFIGAGATDPLWPVLRAASERYARTHPYYQIRAMTPDIVSPQEQAVLIRRMLGDLDFRGLCVQVSDPDALGSVLTEASIHGVRVVTMLRDVKAGFRHAHCGIDEESIGRQLARAGAEAVNDRGNIMVLTSSTEDPAYAKRLDGFRGEIDRHIDVHVLAYAECGGNLLAAHRLLEEYTRRYPSVGAWVMLDNWAISRRGNSLSALVGTRPVVAMNPFPKHWERLESGECFALVGGDYGRIGYEALRLCETAIGSTVSATMESLVPAEIVRASQLVSFRIRWITWSSPMLDVTEQVVGSE